MSRCYYFIDSDNTECVSNELPTRTDNGYWEICDKINGNIVELPPNTIYSLFNIHLSFDDDPICIEY